jgi:UDP-N-acetylglucosamine 2-epimerase (non-hydrolysing)
VSRPLAACVVGTRPNFVKIAPLLSEFERRGRFETLLLHTGQHFSPEMSEDLFADLDIRAPDVNLGVGGGTAAQQTAAIMLGIEDVFLRRRPAVAVVVGDVTSTMAAALAAVKLNIPVAHVEAGLRSFDRSMPEEIHRIVTDAVSSYFFVTETSGRDNLLAEGVPAERIFFTGNVMIDTLLHFRGCAAASTVLERLGIQSRGYGVLTLHRPANVDDAGRLAALVEAVRAIARELPLVFPVHPRTRQKLAELGLNTSGLILTGPVGYRDFLRLLDQSRLVLTDSGGIQEETTVLGVPCLTLRENTERPVTVEQGTNRLVGVDGAAILTAAREALAREAPAGRIPELWDGQASARIVRVLESLF